jgi:hypothetical protein
VLAALGALALAAVALPLVTAGAEATVVRQYSGAADAGAVDLDGNGTVDAAPYDLTARAISVGEHPRAGSDLRLFLPFRITPVLHAAVRGGGAATVTIRFRRVWNVDDERVLVDAYSDSTTATARDFARPATRLAALAPLEGRVAVDVARVIRSMSAPGPLVLRLRVDHRDGGGPRTRVTIPTSETRDPASRPVLAVTVPDGLGNSGGPSPAPVPPVPVPPVPVPPAPVPPAPVPPAPVPPAPPAAGEVFRDDFNGTTLDLAKWRPNWLAGNDTDITKPVNSAELSCYDPAQVSVSGGFLHLKAAARSCRDNQGRTYPYASGLVESAHDFTFTYGRIEARMWLPGSGAIQNWPAFWANGTGQWPTTGELDVMEGLHGRACWHFHSTAGGPGGCAPLANPAGWHTFAAEWRAGVVTYFYDGQQVGRIAANITSSPMFLIFNLGISTEHAPPVQLPSEVLVDWVRVTR